MKINCDKKWLKSAEWADWFAWYPIRLETGDCRWLETLQRKNEYAVHEDWGDALRGHYKWEYRAK